MTGSRKLAPRATRLATGRQLWRLNQEGLLRLSEEQVDPINSSPASDAIQRVITENRPGESRFPSEASPHD
jgi:hypothetical protein